MTLSIFAACRCLVLDSMPRPEVSKTNILNANLIYDFIVLDLYLLNIDKTRFNSNVSSSLSRLSIEIEAPYSANRSWMIANIEKKKHISKSLIWKHQDRIIFRTTFHTIWKWIAAQLEWINIVYFIVCIHALIKHLFVFIPSHNLQYYTESIHSTVQGFCCNI